MFVDAVVADAVALLALRMWPCDETMLSLIAVAFLGFCRAMFGFTRDGVVPVLGALSMIATTLVAIADPTLAPVLAIGSIAIASIARLEHRLRGVAAIAPGLVAAVVVDAPEKYLVFVALALYVAWLFDRSTSTVKLTGNKR